LRASAAWSRRATSPLQVVLRIATFRASLLLLAALVLQGCAGNRGMQLPEMPDWIARQSVLESIDRWEFSGRIGVSAGAEGFNGKVRWWQDGTHFRATVSGPLGAGTVRIEGDGRRLTLTDKQGEVTQLQDAETDLRLRYGWTIPVTSLRYWALGIPDPSVPATTELGDDGLVRELEQGDWRVSFGQYRDGGGQQMPRRLLAVNADAKVRLVIDKWIFFGE
jgi:outer membrane lipoprotein LolB